MTLSELTREDYLGLKWHFVMLLLGLGLVVAAFVYTGGLRDEAQRQLNFARSDLNRAQSQLDQATEEENTIGNYLLRYNTLAASGSVASGDRLAMQERFTQIRARHNLFPIQLQIGTQSTFTLPESASFNAPVQLLTSSIQVSLPLLHENDLARLLSDIHEAPDLLLARDCSLRLRNNTDRHSLDLGPHQNASCSFFWFSFEATEKRP